MNISIWLKKPLIIILSCIVLAPTLGFAQDTASSIRGKVLDSSGNPNSAVSVEIIDTRTGVTRTYTTNSSGTFFASRLPVGGPYTITTDSGESVTVDSIRLGDTYHLTLGKAANGNIEEVTIVGQLQQVQTAAGPSATYGNTALRQAVAFDRDIKDVFQFDPRINIDLGGSGSAVNCAGKHPRFNSTTLDGVSHNDRFGLNDNGYSTATGLPFPFDGIEQVSVELAPFDVTYGGFSACNINAVTKAGSNEWTGSVFYEYTTDGLRGDSLTSQVSVKATRKKKGL